MIKTGKVVRFKNWDCDVYKTNYPIGNAPELILHDRMTHERVAVASANILDAELQEGEALIKDYSENYGILDALVAADVVERTGRTVPTGFVEADVVRLKV